MWNVNQLAQKCAPNSNGEVIEAIAKVESDYNPYAIGIVGGHLKKQPKNPEEAIRVANVLEKRNVNFSIGILQINYKNLKKLNFSYSEALNPCINLGIGSNILEECYLRARKKFVDTQYSLKAAFSCYYSGNFEGGFKLNGKVSYVGKITAAVGELKIRKISNFDSIKMRDKQNLIKSYSHDSFAFNAFQTDGRDKKEIVNQKPSNEIVF